MSGIKHSLIFNVSSMFTEFPVLSDEAEVYGAARFCFTKAFSQLNGEEFWDYQAGKQQHTKMAHFVEIFCVDFDHTVHCLVLKGGTP